MSNLVYGLHRFKVTTGQIVLRIMNLGVFVSLWCGKEELAILPSYRLEEDSRK